jgi:hypothetical protein
MKQKINDVKRLQELAGIIKEELEIGDSIELDASKFPNYEFPYGTTGEIINIDNADYASEDLTYTIKIKYIDPTGEEQDTLVVDEMQTIQ